MMKLLLENWKRYINEQLQPEAPNSAPLGQYAFSPQRQVYGKPPPPVEDNTKLENELLEAIIAHFNDNIQLTKDVGEQIIQFMKNNQYSKIFKSPNEEYVCRGYAVKKDYIDSINKQYGLNIDFNNISEPKDYEKTFILAPKQGTFASSWTTDEEIADGFALSRGLGEYGNEAYIVVVFAKPDNPANKDRFIDSSGLYEIEAFHKMETEREVIGLGNIEVYKVRIYKP